VDGVLSGRDQGWFVTNGSVGALGVGDDGRVTTCDSAAVALLSRPVEQIVGRPLAELLPLRLGADTPGCSLTLRPGETGREIDVMVSGPSPSGRTVLLCARAPGEAKGEDGGDADAHRYFAELGELLRQESDARQVLRTANELLGGQLGVDRVYIAELEDEEQIVISASWSRDGVPTLEGGRNTMSSFGEANREAHRRGETIVIADMAKLDYLDARGVRALAKLGIVSGVNVPLMKDGELAAFLSVQHGRVRTWTSAEVRLIEETAERTWAALQRARAETRLRESEAQFRTLAENMPSICWLGDPRGSAFWMNRRGVEFFGPLNDQVMNMAAIHPDEKARALGRWREALKTGRALEMTLSLRNREGQFRPCLARAEPVRDASGAVARWCGVITDLSEQRAAEDRRAFLLDLGERLRDETDAGRVLEITAERLGRRLGASRVCYSEVDADGETLCVERDWTDGQGPSVIGRYPWPASVPKWRRRTPGATRLVAADTTDHPIIPRHKAERLKRLGFAACIDVPLIRHGRLAALLHVHQREPRRWTPDEVLLVEEVADRTWATLNRARAEAQLRARERDQSFLLAWSDQVRHDDDPRSILSKTVRAVGEHLGVERVNYAEADEAGGSLVVQEDWTDGLPSVAGRVFPMAVFGEAVMADHYHGRPFRTDDMQSDPRFTPESRALYAAVGARAIVSVPLIKDGRISGVLSMQQAQPRAWTADEVRLLEEVAERSWATLERARSEERMRESEALLSAFMENAPVGMFLKDAQGRHERLNPEMAKALGFSVEESLGRTTDELIGDRNEFRFADYDKRVLAGETQRHELSYGGSSEYASSLVIRFPVRVGDGPVTRIGGFAIDLTDRKRAEAELQRSRDQLHQSEKLTAWGRCWRV
jgi:PAS domain S-box-containing protein